MPSQRIEIPIGRREAKAKSPFVSSQSCENCFVERDPEPGIADAIYGAPGLVQFAECGSGPVRGLALFNGTLLAVSGGELYTVTSAGVATSVGGVAGYDPVIISNNGTQAVIVSDSTSYVWDGTTFTAINDADFRRASSVDFLRQTFIFTAADSALFFTSALADGTDYDALDVATAESKPDKVLRVMVDAGEALFFGETSVDPWYFSGAPTGVPLSPVGSGALSVGLAGRDAVTKVDNTIAWMSNLIDFRTLRNNSPIAIADPSIISTIQGWTNPGSARCFTISARGHEWMVVRHAQGCVLWDATTGLWSSRKSHGMDTWRVASAERAYGHTILGDATNGKLWRLDADVYAEGSEPLVRSLVSRTLGPGGAPFTLDGLEVEVETGVGLASGQGSDPQIWAEFSNDSGVTYGTRLTRSMGRMGERTKRVCWTGPFGDFPPHGGVIRIGCSDPVRLVVTRAWADITVNKS